MLRKHLPLLLLGDDLTANFLMPKHELTPMDKVDGEKLMRTRPYTKKYRQLREAERRGGGLLQGKTH